MSLQEQRDDATLKSEQESRVSFGGSNSMWGNSTNAFKDEPYGTSRDYSEEELTVAKVESWFKKHMGGSERWNTTRQELYVALFLNGITFEALKLTVDKSSWLLFETKMFSDDIVIRNRYSAERMK